MAITSHTKKWKDVDQSNCGAMYGFEATQSDVNYFEDPRVTGKLAISKGISIYNPSSEAIVLVNVEGNTITIPAGLLADGVIHPLAGIVRLNDTGTGASVRVMVWI
jgi:hypothetical protein